MSIEVRQLHIRSSVGPEDGQREGGGDSDASDALRAELLDECRKLFRELMQAERER